MIENKDFFRETAEGKELLKMGHYMYGPDFPQSITRDLLHGYWQNELNEKRQRKPTSSMVGKDTTAFRFFLHDQYKKGFPGLFNPEWCINRAIEAVATTTTAAVEAVDSDQSFESNSRDVQVIKRKKCAVRKTNNNTKCPETTSPLPALLTSSSISTTVTPYNSTTSSTSASVSTATAALALTTGVNDNHIVSAGNAMSMIVSPNPTLTDIATAAVNSDVSTVPKAPIKMPTDWRSYLNQLTNKKNTVKSEVIASNTSAGCSSSSSDVCNSLSNTNTSNSTAVGSGSSIVTENTNVIIIID